MIVPVILVCNSLLINVCMFILSKALLISSPTVILRAGGAILVEPICYLCCVDVFGLFAVM